MTLDKGWTLDYDRWHDLSQIVDDVSWKCVPLDIAHKSVVPDTPGVYMICGKTPVLCSHPFNKFFNVLYVGLSESSVRSRFRSHCSKPERDVVNAKKLYKLVGSKMSFYFAAMSNQRVNSCELHLIECFGPSANRQSGNKKKIKGKLGLPTPAG